MAVPHIGFILAAYAVTAIVVGGAIAAVLVDRRSLLRAWRSWRSVPAAAARAAPERRDERTRQLRGRERPAPPRAPRLLVVLPLVAFAGLAVLFVVRLGAGDPSRIPSPLIGLPVPEFSLPPLPGRAAPDGTAGGPAVGLDTAALRAGHVTLVNVFASWCAECHDEHEVLMALAKSPRLKDLGIPLDGIVYKDKAEDARRYLGSKGDPYAAIGDDRTGRTAIDFGVYGVPKPSWSRATARWPLS